MNWWSLRNNRLKFKTSREVLIILEDSTEYTSNINKEKPKDHYMHNIIKIHSSSVMWDWHHSVEYSSHSAWKHQNFDTDHAPQTSPCTDDGLKTSSLPISSMASATAAKSPDEASWGWWVPERMNLRDTFGKVACTSQFFPFSYFWAESPPTHTLIYIICIYKNWVSDCVMLYMMMLMRVQCHINKWESIV